MWRSGKPGDFFTLNQSLCRRLGVKDATEATTFAQHIGNAIGTALLTHTHHVALPKAALYFQKLDLNKVDDVLKMLILVTLLNDEKLTCISFPEKTIRLHPDLKNDASQLYGEVSDAIGFNTKMRRRLNAGTNWIGNLLSSAAGKFGNPFASAPEAPMPVFYNEKETFSDDDVDWNAAKSLED